jgi:hypothetical protein
MAPDRYPTNRHRELTKTGEGDWSQSVSLIIK